MIQLQLSPPKPSPPIIKYLLKYKRIFLHSYPMRYFVKYCLSRKILFLFSPDFSKPTVSFKAK